MSDIVEKPTSPGSPARTARGLPLALIIRIAAPLMVVAGIILLVSGAHETRTVSAVIQEIREIALAEPQGGLIGSWWVSAAGTDPETGRLQDFKVECGTIQLASRSAEVIVNAHQDSFQFEMWDVVFVPTEPDAAGEEPTVQRRTRYMLGPLPYPYDIVADEK